MKTIRQYLGKVYDDLIFIANPDELVNKRNVIYVFYEAGIVQSLLFLLGKRFNLREILRLKPRAVVTLEPFDGKFYRVRTPTGVTLPRLGILTPGYFSGKSNVRKGEILCDM